MNNIIDNLTVRMRIADVTELAIAVKTLEERVKTAEDELGRERADFAAYKSAEDEREQNRQMRDEETLQQRLAALAKNERKCEAMEEYYRVKATSVNRIYETVKKRLTKTERKELQEELRKTDEAWDKFDNIQKELLHGSF